MDLPKPPHVRIEDVQRAVCDYAQVSHADLIDACRWPELVVVRHVAMALCVRLTKQPNTRIGRAFGRHERAVRHAAGKYGRLVPRKPESLSAAVSGAFEAICQRGGAAACGYVVPNMRDCP